MHRKKKARRAVIYYHNVREQDTARFEKQMAHLAKNCHVVKASEINRVKTSAKQVVAITFDDGFVSVVKNAIPVLRKYGLTAAIAVPAGNLGQQPGWLLEDGGQGEGELVLNEEQLLELDRAGFEVVSHTMSHPVLTRTEDDKLKLELVNSKQVLEEIVGHEVIGISYPHGAYDKRVCRAAKDAMYKLGFTIEPLMMDETTDNMRIGRFSVSPQDGLFKFGLKISGAYQVTSYLRALKARLFGKNETGYSGPAL